MKTHRLLFFLVVWEKGAFPEKKCDYHENKNKKLKLIAEIASHINFTYCVQISERLEEIFLKMQNLATAPINWYAI